MQAAINRENKEQSRKTTTGSCSAISPISSVAYHVEAEIQNGMIPHI